MDEKKIKSYDELMENIKLKSLYIDNLDFRRLKIENKKEKLAILVNFETKEPEIIENTGNNITVLQPVSFKLNLEGSPDEKLFELNVSYLIYYHLEYEVESELIFEYVKNTIPKLLHPYLRELISSSVQKVGLPPYVLPLYENL